MPKDKLQVATIFSGIGAAEFALIYRMILYLPAIMEKLIS